MKLEIDQIESDIDRQEQELEFVEAEKEELQKREDALGRAMEFLQEDSAVADRLAKNVGELKQDKNAQLEKIQEMQDSIGEILGDLQEELDTIGDERSKLEMLTEIGEDVSEAQQVLTDRESLIHEAENRLNEVASRLGITLNELEDRLLSTVAGLDGKKTEENADLEELLNPEGQENLSDHENPENLSNEKDAKENSEESDAENEIENESKSRLHTAAGLSSFSNDYNDSLNQGFADYILSDPTLTDEQKAALLAGLGNGDSVAEEPPKPSGLQEAPESPFKAGADDRLPSPEANISAQEAAMQKARDTAAAFLSVQHNEANLNDPDAYNISMGICADELEKAALAMDSVIEQETDPLRHAMLVKDQRYLRDLKREAEYGLPEEYKNLTFLGPKGKNFTDSYANLITDQGRAYDIIQGDCGVCSMVNLVNQQGGRFTEKSGIAYGYGIFGFDDTIEKRYDNGGTNLVEQLQILYRLGGKGTYAENGLDFDTLASKFTSGCGVSLNLHANDLSSGHNIQPRAIVHLPILTIEGKKDADHAVVVAGLAKTASGEITGLFVNDSGGHGGRNHPAIYISREKYEKMRAGTSGFSSIICEGIFGEQ